MEWPLQNIAVLVSEPIKVVQGNYVSWALWQRLWELVPGQYDVGSPGRCSRQFCGLANMPLRLVTEHSVTPYFTHHAHCVQILNFCLSLLLSSYSFAVSFSLHITAVDLSSLKCIVTLKSCSLMWTLTRQSWHMDMCDLCTSERCFGIHQKVKSNGRCHVHCLHGSTNHSDWPHHTASCHT